MADTLCLSCARCYGDCPWSERDPETKHIKFQPVPGGRQSLHGSGLRGLIPCGRLPAVCERREGLLRRPGASKPKYDVRAVSDCLRAGMTDREIMRRTGIQSERTLQEYKRRARSQDRRMT